VNCYQRVARLLNAVARCALWVLLAAISSGSVLAQDAGEKSDGPTIRARNAFYEVRRTPPDQYLNCLYRDQIKLLCPSGVEFVSVEKHYRTRDYDLLVISMGDLDRVSGGMTGS